METTPLESWIKARIGPGAEAALPGPDLIRYQMARLQDTLAYALRNSPFYQRLLSGLSLGGVTRPDDISSLPFTTADDLRRHHLDMLCLSQGEISRVVTLRTSGTTGQPKRLYFTDDDLELTTDFFHHGMSTLVRSGQKVLVLMPGQTPGSVGDLLVKGLERMGVEGFVHGPVRNPDIVIDEILEKRIDCLVAIPAQLPAIVRHPRGGRNLGGRIESVLLSTDYVPQAIVDELTETWHCRVFEHYGMTEMGYGGGVHCLARTGYHLREADLFFEVIDPDSDRPVRDGETGEVVFTTLTRRGMPLIRYRTGDLSRFIPEPCPCGAALRRLDKITGRVKGSVVLCGSVELDISSLDEAVFGVPGITDFSSEILRHQGRDCLVLKVCPGFGYQDSYPDRIKTAVENIPAVREASVRGPFKVQVRIMPAESVSEPSTGAAKRKIVDRR